MKAKATVPRTTPQPSIQRSKTRQLFGPGGQLPLFCGFSSHEPEGLLEFDEYRKVLANARRQQAAAEKNAKALKAKLIQ